MIQRQVPLAPYSSWLVGGPAEYFALPTTIEQTLEAVRWAYENKQPITILGGGSNVLISDQGVRGLVLCLRKLSGLHSEVVADKLQITALAGTSKSELLKVFLKHKLEPALFLAGLPGDVGGGIAMNAGVGEAIRPREFVEITDWIDVLPLGASFTPDIQRFRREDLKWDYRHCRGFQPGVVLAAGLSWPAETQPDILAKVKEANKIRLSKQPLHLPSCGSVFINPEGYKSGALIDQCGLRGYRSGGAQVSEKHANFIVNVDSAKAIDIHHVITHVQDEVLRLKGVRLQTEVVYLGRLTN